MKFQRCCRYVQLCCPNVERPFDFVASVYGAEATRSTLSTFNKVDCVEWHVVPGFSVRTYVSSEKYNTRYEMFRTLI